MALIIAYHGVKCLPNIFIILILLLAFTCFIRNTYSIHHYSLNLKCDFCDQTFIANQKNEHLYFLSNFLCLWSMTVLSCFWWCLEAKFKLNKHYGGTCLLCKKDYCENQTLQSFRFFHNQDSKNTKITNSWFLW